MSREYDTGLSNTELAKRLGVTEGTIRYQKKRLEKEMADGRKNRHSDVSTFSTAIEIWAEDNLEASRAKRKTVWSLYNALCRYHNYNLSYDALRRYIKKRYPEIFRKSYFIRVETPPGKLSQIDWKESISVQLFSPGNWTVVNFLIMELCFSRRPAIIARLDRTQQSFLSAHLEAVKKLGGTTEYIRSDCMATAVKMWRGQESVMNREYDKFLKDIGAIAFPARPGEPTDKGKVEKKIQDVFRDIDFRHIVFRNLEELQKFIDGVIENHCLSTICPVTGTTIDDAYDYERPYLIRVENEDMDIPVDSDSIIVQKGSVVRFRGNLYQIPDGFIGKSVRVINTGTKIHIYHDGNLLETFDFIPEQKGALRLSEKALMSTQRPMSDLTRQWALEVATRQIEYYQEITGGRV